MSRYVIDLDENREFVYGFDHALGYFYEFWDNNLGEEDYDRLVEDKSYVLSGLKKFEMIEVMEKYGAKQDHIMNVSLDLPF